MAGDVLGFGVGLVGGVSVGAVHVRDDHGGGDIVKVCNVARVENLRKDDKIGKICEVVVSLFLKRNFLKCFIVFSGLHPIGSVLSWGRLLRRMLRR